MSWKVRQMLCARRNSCNRMKCTMGLWRIFCWASRVNRTEGQMLWGAVNVGGSIVIVCLGQWKRWMCKLWLIGIFWRGKKNGRKIPQKKKDAKSIPKSILQLSNISTMGPWMKRQRIFFLQNAKQKLFDKDFARL